MSSAQAPISKANVKNEKPSLTSVLSTTTIGFLASSARAHSVEASPYERLKPSVQAFRKFLNTTGIDSEVWQSLNLQLLPRLGLLSQIQTILNQRYDRRELSRLTTPYCQSLPTSQEALRYCRYATAVYGADMIAAAQIGKKTKKTTATESSSSSSTTTTTTTTTTPTTRSIISDHIGIPQDDIVLLDVDYDEDTNHNHLRHFVAIEHQHQRVVLSIRGTFTLSEIVVDITAFSRPCFDDEGEGGEAHGEILTMAQRVWEAAGETILRLLQEHPTYELILTGHSLGAGCACLVNMMCHRNPLLKERKIRCFAFACPPLFTPLELIPEAVLQSTTNYILEQDVVPFLSVDSVRHVFHCVRTIEEYLQTKMTATERMNLTLARTKPPPRMIEAVHQAGGCRLEPKQGAPVLSIPAAVNVWMKEKLPLGEYDFEACDSIILSWLGLNVDVQYFQYHLPPRYEHALENLMDEI